MEIGDGDIPSPRRSATAGRNVLRLLDPRTYLEAVRAIATLSIHDRALTLELTKREIQAEHAGKAFGSFWGIFQPLFLLAVYAFVYGVVFKAKIGGTFELPRNFTVYLLSGLVPWFAFLYVMAKAATVITANAHLVKQVVFKLNALPVAVAYAALVPLTLGLGFVGVFSFATYRSLPWTYALLPVAVTLQFVAMLGVSFALAATGVFFRDVRDFVQLAAVILIFLMPIVYLPAPSPPRSTRCSGSTRSPTWCTSTRTCCTTAGSSIRSPGLLSRCGRSSFSRSDTTCSVARALLRQRPVSATVVKVKNASKAYSLYGKPRDVLLEAVFGGERHDVFWALRDVSFEVPEGERVGFVGPNGAGKSTLLKLITGNLMPTRGRIEVNGRVSAHPVAHVVPRPRRTGLENIRFNLVMNGVPKKQIPSLTEEIVNFTELGAFIHAPVRTYSSGMSARLSFTISTSITPDILVVDEILGAGDAYFAAKATLRMVELCKQGRALPVRQSRAERRADDVRPCDLARRRLDPGDGRGRRDRPRLRGRLSPPGGRVESVREHHPARRPPRQAAPGRAPAHGTRPPPSHRPDEQDQRHALRPVPRARSRRGRDAHDPARVRRHGGLRNDRSLDVTRSEWGRPHTRKGADSAPCSLPPIRFEVGTCCSGARIRARPHGRSGSRSNPQA